MTDNNNREERKKNLTDKGVPDYHAEVVINTMDAITEKIGLLTEDEVRFHLATALIICSDYLYSLIYSGHYMEYGKSVNALGPEMVEIIRSTIVPAALDVQETYELEKMFEAPSAE